MPTHDPVPLKRGAKAGSRAEKAKPSSIVRYAAGGRARRCFSRSGAQWTEATEEAFLEALAASASVKWAASQIGYSPGSVYYQRRTRADFAAKVEAALEQAYCTLEFNLVRAAIDTMEGVQFEGDQPVPQMTVDQALRTLWVYRASKVTGKGMGPLGKPKDLDEVRDSIMKKVLAIKNARPKK